jgi:hypothetical protein
MGQGIQDDEAMKAVLEVASVKSQVQAIIRRLRAGLDELESILPVEKGPDPSVEELSSDG